MNNTPHAILVIDDNHINRKYLQSVLSNNGFSPIITESGYEALDTLQDTEVALILVDIQMPGMDGFECFRQIRSNFGTYCPILAITAFSDLSDKKTIIDFGFNDYITKPVKPNVLIDTLNYWITNYSKQMSVQPADNSNHIDHSVLNELLRFTDEDSLLQLIDEFVQETEGNIQSIAFLKHADKHAEILSILHVIKGNAGSFGFVSLSSKAAKIEELIKEEKFEKANSDLNEFLEYSEFLLRDYQRLLKID